MLTVHDAVSTIVDAADEPKTVAHILGSDLLTDPILLAGCSGLDRVVARINHVDHPESIGFWLRPQDLISTTSFTLAHSTETLPALLTRASSVGAAGMVVHFDDVDVSVAADARAVADDLGLPLIGVSESFELDHELAAGVRARMTHQARAVFRAERLRKVLTDSMLAGAGIAELASDTASELECAVLVTTSDGRKLASAGAEEDSIAFENSSALDGTGRLKTDSTDGGLGLRPSSEGTVAVCAITANGLDHGRVAVFSRHRALSEADLYSVDTAAAVFAMVVTRDLALSAIEEKHRSNFLRDLLLGRGGEHPHAVAHARRFGWDIDRPVVVVAIEPVQESDDSGPAPARRPLVDRQMLAFSGALAQRDSRAAIAALGTETVIIMGGGPSTVRDVHDIVERVRGAGGGGRQPFSVGISRPCTTVEEIPGMYGQARTALKVGRQVSGTWAVTTFDELGVFRLLSLVENDGELESFTQETLHDLTEQTDEARDMRRTLEMLLATNINIAETARKLHFHYNTLRYRVVKLEKILGPFTDRPDLRLDLSLALKIMTMRGIDHHT